MQAGAAPDGECTCVCAMHVGGECPAHEEAKKFFTFTQRHLPLLVP